jgi:nitroreductase
MDVVDAIKQRKSIRAFKSDPVKLDLLKKIIEQAQRAPSWANTSSPSSRSRAAWRADRPAPVRIPGMPTPAYAKTEAAAGKTRKAKAKKK